MTKLNSTSGALTFIDLFSGAGGLSEGFLSSGFFPIAHIEKNADACHTLQTRLCYHYFNTTKKPHLYTSYLKKEISRDKLFESVPKRILSSVINEVISEDSLNSIFAKIDGLMINSNKDKIDLVIGGPPCQAYSLVGRAVSKNGMRGDSRNHLYKMYIKVIDRYRPKMFLFENVPGMLSAQKGKYWKDLQKKAKNIGYNLDKHIVQANEYGVLQKRVRVIVIGMRSDFMSRKFSFPKGKKHSFTIRDLLSDLPSPSFTDEGVMQYQTPPTKYCLSTKIRTVNDVLTWHRTRTINDHDKKIYYIAIQKWLLKHERLSYIDIPSELKTHKNEKAFLDRFKVVGLDEPHSQTMLAHISKDGHYYIYPDIKQCRSLSVREAARIQSFPDSFYFEGSRTSAFMQIGNAVPPLLSKKIASSIKAYLIEENENGY